MHDLLVEVNMVHVDLSLLLKPCVHACLI